jgi:hypothetical protein
MLPVTKDESFVSKMDIVANSRGVFVAPSAIIPLIVISSASPFLPSDRWLDRGESTNNKRLNTVILVINLIRDFCGVKFTGLEVYKTA